MERRLPTRHARKRGITSDSLEIRKGIRLAYFPFQESEKCTGNPYLRAINYIESRKWLRRSVTFASMIAFWALIDWFAK